MNSLARAYRLALVATVLFGVLALAAAGLQRNDTAGTRQDAGADVHTEIDGNVVALAAVGLDGDFHVVKIDEARSKVYVTLDAEELQKIREIIRDIVRDIVQEELPRAFGPTDADGRLWFSKNKLPPASGSPGIFHEDPCSDPNPDPDILCLPVRR